MAVCAVDNGSGALELSPSTPLDECSYIVLDALDYASFIAVPIGEVYSLLFVGIFVLVMGLGVIAGRQRSW